MTNGAPQRDRMMWSEEAIDLAAFADSDLALERDLDGQFWATTDVAGLQYYRYGRSDDFVGRVIPKAGDRLSLMRRPTNPRDDNAVEVWWRNSFHLGHLPGGVAASVASGMDSGQALRAYVLDGGDGEAWSMHILLVGPATHELHGERLRHVARLRREREEQEFRDVMASVWPEPRQEYDPATRGIVWRATIAPTAEQQAAAASFEALRHRRRADAIYAFNLVERAAVDLAADPGPRGAGYSWWDEVPPGLMTKTQWREAGHKVPPTTAAYATISYGRGRHWRGYDLYSVVETEPMRKVAPDVRAAAAERAYWASIAPLDANAGMAQTRQSHMIVLSTRGIHP